MANIDISEATLQAVEDAIAHGFEKLQDGDVDLVPVLTTNVAIIVMPDQSIHQLHDAIQKMLADGAITAGVLVTNGYLTLQGVRTRAVMAEAYEEGKTTPWVFAQPYRPATAGTPLERIGRLKLLAGNNEFR